MVLQTSLRLGVESRQTVFSALFMWTPCWSVERSDGQVLVLILETYLSLNNVLRGTCWHHVQHIQFHVMVHFTSEHKKHFRFQLHYLLLFLKRFPESTVLLRRIKTAASSFRYNSEAQHLFLYLSPTACQVCCFIEAADWQIT